MSVTTQFIVICKRAFIASGTNNLNLINIFTQLNAGKFPFTYSHFSVVVNFDTTEAGDHSLRILISGPDGGRIAHSEFPVRTDATNWQVIASYERITFPKPGTYTFAVEMDGAALGDRSLRVVPAVAESRSSGVA